MVVVNMEQVEDTLLSLTEHLRLILDRLKGDLNQELMSSLHDSSNLPNKRLASLSAEAVDLLNETQQILQPGSSILADHFLGYADSKCLSAAVAYKIPDSLRDGNKTVDELAVASGTGSMQLRRVMRVLSNKGIFKYNDASDNCSNNHVSELLLSDHWTKWAYWVELYGSEFYDMARGIPAACHKDATRSPGQIEFDSDKNMFTIFSERGWLSRFHQTLGAGAIAQAPGLLEDYPWESIKDCTFLDIGGGAGALVASIVRKFPLMTGGVLDTAEVIAQAKANFHGENGEFADVKSGVPESNLIVGNFLNEVPSFEVFTMKWCLHDWTDDYVLTILNNIRKAIKKGPNSRLIIFESVLQDGHSARLSRFADLNMWIAVNGRERTAAQWKDLAHNSGWKVREIIPLRNAWPSAIELVPLWENVGETVSTTEDKNPLATEVTNNAVPTTEDDRDSGLGSEEHDLPAAKDFSNEVSQVSTTMTFIEPWDNSRGNPFYRSAAPPGMETVNFKWVDEKVIVSDARHVRDQFNLDRNAFAYLETDELTSELREVLRIGDREAVQKIYYPKVEALVKKETNASRVIIFDHTLRKRDPNRDKTDNASGKEQPATTVHCDQSRKGALRRLKQNLGEGDDYEEIIKGRVQLINVWRPLNGTVIDWPLAQMDFITLKAEHVHPVDLLRGKSEDRGQTVTIEHADAQRWWHLGGHRTNEVTLLKIWDSWGDRGVADICPHAAFKHPKTPANAEARESVEVRCLVLHEVVAE